MSFWLSDLSRCLQQALDFSGSEHGPRGVGEHQSSPRQCVTTPLEEADCNLRVSATQGYSEWPRSWFWEPDLCHGTAPPQKGGCGGASGGAREASRGCRSAWQPLRM